MKKTASTNQIKFKHLQLILLFVAVLIGILVHRDYGVGYDEGYNYYYGHQVLNEVRGVSEPIGNPVVYENSPEMGRLFGKPTVVHLKGRFGVVVSEETYFTLTHGPLYEVILAAMDRVLSIDTARGIYHFRHIAVYMTFILALILFYVLARQLNFSPVLATLGCVGFFLSPRLFAHAFHNSYDTAFLAFFLAASLGCLLFVRRESWKWALLAGVACGLAIDVRIMALILLPLALGSWFLVGIVRRERRRFLNPLLFLGSAILMMWAFWPALWDNPFGGTMQALFTSALDPWGGREAYLGERIHGSRVPWHFTPVWMLATTPVLFTVCCFTGIGVWLRRFRFSQRDVELLFVAGCLVGPLVVVAALGSTLFNGWRHFYYVYPSFLVFALLGAEWMWSKARGRTSAEAIPRSSKLSIGRKALIGVGVLQLGYVTLFAVQSHPHQMIFFNSVLGMKRGYELFEVGLWGSQLHEGVEKLLEMVPDEEIRVSEFPKSVGLNVAMLEDKDRARIKLVPFWEADYFVHNYRVLSDLRRQFRYRYPDREWQGTAPWDGPPMKLVWERKVWGVPVVEIYDIKGYSD